MDGQRQRLSRACGSGGGASAELEEPSTLVAVEGEWAAFMAAHREHGKFIDVTLIVGGRRIEAHKNVITSLSPYLDGLLTSGLAESAAQSQELTLEHMDGAAVEAVVDCMYSGKLSLSSRTATAVVTAANLLQVGAVEKAAGEFFLSKLEPTTAADALAFAAERSACGEHAKALHDKCIEFAVAHFAAVTREASFLSLPCDTIARFVASDDLPVEEPDVVRVVRSWFEHDAAGRKEALKALVQLIRWPLLPRDAQKALDKEPLVDYMMQLDKGSRSLGIKMLLECSSDLREEDCPRLKPRKGTPPPPVPKLAFTAMDSDCYETQDDGAAVTATKSVWWHAAKCGDHVMNSGKHCAEFSFTVEASGPLHVFVGLARPNLDVSVDVSVTAYDNPQFWGWWSIDGEMWNGTETGSGWEGQQSFGSDDVVRLLLDSDAGTLTVKKNSTLLGTAVGNDTVVSFGCPTGDLCWAVCAGYEGQLVRIKAVDPTEF
eukprot:COSAG02_NODE_7309_length_3072_cov_1.527413_3_plen_488_part_00